jgi:alkylation response protein AidB-like acyl-CoA dehydrogenase
MSVMKSFSGFIELERILGDPGVAANTLSFHRSMALDEAEAFPETMVGHLHACRLHHHYVPVELGGAFDSCEVVISLARALSRRDLSVAITYGTLLWTMLAWISGDAQQKHRIAKRVLETGAFPSLAYSEASHGADLLANETSAARDGDGYRVNGEKWPINRATRSEFFVLLARTGGHAARGMSLFMVDKRDLDAATYQHLPRVKTLGLRGCDISGIGFQQCLIPEGARLGAEGAGLEIALKGFQVTRTFCAGLSLGAGDTALRSVVDFAMGRALYGASIVELPHTRDLLANVYLNLLIAECMTLVSARGLHLHTGDFSIWSLIVKAQVPALIEQGIDALSGVLGARFYMREEHQEGIFQKVLRDNQIISVFDGSSVVCLSSLATQLRSTALARKRTQPTTDNDLAALYDLGSSLPAFSPERLELFGRGRDAVLMGLPQLVAMLEGLAVTTACRIDELGALHALVEPSRRLIDELREIDADVLALHESATDTRDPRLFRLAERYCNLHAAAACLGIWLFNRDRASAFFKAGDWLLAILQRRGCALFTVGHLNGPLREALVVQLLTQHSGDSLFSVFDVPIAPRGSSEAAMHVFSQEQAHGV